MTAREALAEAVRIAKDEYASDEGVGATAFIAGFMYGSKWARQAPTEVTDEMVARAATETMRRVTRASFARLDDGPNGDYYREQARAALEAALGGTNT